MKASQQCAWCIHTIHQSNINPNPRERFRSIREDDIFKPLAGCPSVRPSVVKVKTTRRRLARVGVRPAPVPRPRSIVRPSIVRVASLGRNASFVRSISLGRSHPSIHPSIARIHPSVDLAVSTRVVRSFGRSVETFGREIEGNKTKKRRNGWNCVTTTTCRTSEMRFSFSRRRSDNRKTLGHSGKDGRKDGRTARECDARGCPGDDARRDARRPRTRMRPRSEPTRRTTTPRRRRRNDRRDRRMTCVRRRGDRRTDGSRVSFSRAFFDVCLFATMTMGGGFSTSRAATSANGFADRGRGGESVNIFFSSFV